MENDALGLAMSGVDEVAAAHYECRVSELKRFVSDRVGSAEKAIAVAPEFLMVHVLKVCLYGLPTEHEAMAVVRGYHAAAAVLAATAARWRMSWFSAISQPRHWRQVEHIISSASWRQRILPMRWLCRPDTRLTSLQAMPRCCVILSLWR